MEAQYIWLDEWTGWFDERLVPLEKPVTEDVPGQHATGEHQGNSESDKHQA